MTDNDYFLGKTIEGHRVWAHVEIREPEHLERTTFTDHSQGPRPVELGISWTVLASPRHPELAADRYLRGAGQTSPEDRVIPKAPNAARVVEDMWAEFHLNTLNAACDHMTPEMLNPGSEVIDAYIEANPERGRYGRSNALSSWRIDNVVCPETGYRWGSAWLARTIPADRLDALRAALQTLPRKAER
jgi:hypothetical protein